MALAEVEIDVHPPRAGRVVKRARRVLPMRSVSSSIFHPAGVVAHKLLGTIPLLTYLLPGGPQFYTGNRIAGKTFLYGYLACVFLGLLLYGSFWGGAFLGVAFSVHLASITMAADPAPGGVLWRLGRAALYGFLLFTVAYLPISILASYVIDVAVVTGPAAPLEAGDVLLMHYLREPRRGDLVRYTVPYRQYGAGAHAYYYFGGPQIDRVLAVAGDTLEIRRGIVLLNGKPSAHVPLRPRPELQLPPTRVAPASVLILPTATSQAPANQEEEIWRNICIVPVDSVGGIVYWRHQPFSRWGAVP